VTTKGWIVIGIGALLWAAAGIMWVVAGTSFTSKGSGSAIEQLVGSLCFYGFTPAGLLGSLCLAAGTVMIYVANVRKRNSRRCPKCVYDRSGLARGVLCPECGKAAGLPPLSS
jgi:hypothetical protein